MYIYFIFEKISKDAIFRQGVKTKKVELLVRTEESGLRRHWEEVDLDKIQETLITGNKIRVDIYTGSPYYWVQDFI